MLLIYSKQQCKTTKETIQFRSSACLFHAI